MNNMTFIYPMLKNLFVIVCAICTVHSAQCTVHTQNIEQFKERDSFLGFDLRDQIPYSEVLRLTDRSAG